MKRFRLTVKGKLGEVCRLASSKGCKYISVAGYNKKFDNIYLDVTVDEASIIHWFSESEDLLFYSKY